VIRPDERFVSRLVVLVVSAVFAMAGVACGGRLAPIDTTPGGDGGSLDAATDDVVAQVTNDAAPDGGSDASDASPVEASTGCLASPPPPPRVIPSGGPVLAKPRVIPIFFRKDPFQSDVESFLGSLEGSGYWAATTSEYGVGAISVADSIVLDANAPSQFSDADALALLEAHLAGATANWPANAPGNVYTIFLQGDMSDGACGYHDEAAVGGGNVVFAVVERCGGLFDWTMLQTTTIALSHELVEAATDPYPESAPAYATVDADHEAWALAVGGYSELGDLCWNGEATQAQPLVGKYMAQRTWSNAQAAAGHDPCVPHLPGPYVTAVVDPSELTPVTVTDPWGQTVQTRAIQVAVGQTRKVKLQLWSDAPTTPWNLDVVGDENVFGAASSFQVDCGHTATLDVTRSNGSAWDTLEIDSYQEVPYLGYVLVTE
jgi:hypothetical protein